MERTALLFAGQGAQTVGMGRDFAQTIPSAQKWFEHANQTLGYDLSRICFEGPESELTKTENAQPAIFLVGFVAFQLLRERVPNFQFAAAAGLSLGEFTALCASNAIGFDDALRLVRQRGQFMQEACETTEGGMAAIIGLDEAVTREVCAESDTHLANLNCPGQIVISGATHALTKACELAKAKGAKRALPLTVAGAYHSPLMAGAQPKLQQALSQVTLTRPDPPVVSNVTAQPHTDALAPRLIEQVTASVRWEDSIRWLLANGFTQFIELGPGTALSGFLRRIDKNARVLNVADLPSLEKTVQALSA